MRLIAAFMVAVLSVSAFGQSCERTIPVELDRAGLEAKDFAATLNRQNLKIVKVEPIQKSRVLILLPVDRSFGDDRKDFKLILARLSAIDSIPENVSVAYGVYAEKTAFSDRFTSNPQELRNSLAALLTKAHSGELGKNGPYSSPYDICMGNQVLNFQGSSQPGDVLVEFGQGMLTFCDPGKHKDNSPGYGPRSYSELLWGTGTRSWTEHVLENGLREFHVNNYCQDWAGDCAAGAAFNNFGAFTSFLSSTHTSKKDEEDNWRAIRNFFLDSATKGYLVTVEVPPDNGDRSETWYLTLGTDARNRLGVPQTAKTLMAYPDLLLCSTYTKGMNKGLFKIAAVNRQCIVGGSCVFLY